MSETILVVHRRAVDPIRRGHPWVYREAILRAHGPSAPGTVVELRGEDDSRLGYGVHDPTSPLAVRVWGGRRPDGPLFAERLERAFRLRRRLFADGGTTAYRMLNGEGDRAPGLVIDRYGDVAVLRTDGEGARVLAMRSRGELEQAARREGVATLVWRASTKGERKDRDVLFGPSPPDTILVAEHSVPFEVDLASGQKTGAFLDQRENRRRVGLLARSLGAEGRGVRVLNLFSYAGGFSLHAALTGASTTSVDVAPLAHRTAQASFRAAGLDLKGHAFIAADAHTFLAEARKKGSRWDIVISDPPSFAPSERSLSRALSAYRALHQAAAAVLSEDGVLCAASCSSHVTQAAFAETLDDCALGRGDLRLLELHGPPEDHPTLPSFPEGRYLKFAVLA